jgi:hypothetical protein
MTYYSNRMRLSVICHALVLPALLMSFVAVAQTEPDPSFVHGTIVVVVSTKDGFVLAGDSRGTGRNCQPLPGEYEKVFSVGPRSGIVVAGVIGSWLEQNVAESIAGMMHDAADYSDRQPAEATSLIRDFSSGVEGVLALLDGAEEVPSPVAAASAVSISKSGGREWITLYLDPVRRLDSFGIERWAAKVDHFVDPPDSEVVALGAGQGLVERLIGRDSPDPDEPNSQQDIMKRYYLLKREHQLSQLTLGDGQLLAQSLVKAVITFASEHPAQCFGIGGDVQVLDVTRDGMNWILPLDKSKLAPPTPSYRMRFVNSTMRGRLDGAQWVRGQMSANAAVTFSGDGDVAVVQPRFAGNCTFLLIDGAEIKMPSTAQKLRTIFAPHCDVYRETAIGRIPLSTAPIRPQVHNDRPNNYNSLSNAALRSKARELAVRIRAFATDFNNREEQARNRESAAERHMTQPEELNVLSCKEGLLRFDRAEQFSDEYQRRFVPEAVSLRHELIKRVPYPARAGRDAGFWNSPEEMYQVADNLDSLTNALPATP